MDDISFTVGRGEIFGLLGPNGAGKTTTILMMLGLTDVTAGSVSVLGHNPAREPLQVKRLVGYLPDTVGFYDHMTALDHLGYTSAPTALQPAVRVPRTNPPPHLAPLAARAARPVAVPAIRWRRSTPALGSTFPCSPARTSPLTQARASSTPPPATARTTIRFGWTQASPATPSPTPSIPTAPTTTASPCSAA